MQKRFRKLVQAGVIWLHLVSTGAAVPGWVARHCRSYPLPCKCPGAVAGVQVGDCLSQLLLQAAWQRRRQALVSPPRPR